MFKSFSSYQKQIISLLVLVFLLVSIIIIRNYLPEQRGVRPRASQSAQLVGYWNFDEGSGNTAYDKSIYKNNGTLINGPKRVKGKLNNALQFDGVNDYVEIADRPSLDITGKITIEAWVKLGANSPTLIRKEGAYLLEMGASGWGQPGKILQLLIWHASTGGEIRLVESAKPLDTKWHHVAAIYDKAYGYIYVDGSLVKKENQAGYTGAIPNTSTVLRIGSAPEYGEYFKGIIDEVKIWNGVRIPDFASPTVSITSPKNGSTVLGIAIVKAKASDNQGVTKVEFYVDGKKKFTDTSSPYSFNWNTADYSNSNHNLKAKAYDAAKNTRTYSITAKVSNPPFSSIPSSATITDQDILKRVRLKISIPYLLGKIKLPVKLGKFSTQLDATVGTNEYIIDVSKNKFFLGKSYQLRMGGNKLLVKKLSFKAKAPNMPVKFGSLSLGDITGDNKINDEDINSFLDSLKNKESNADINLDGVSNSLDWGILLVNFGRIGDR